MVDDHGERKPVRTAPPRRAATSCAVGVALALAVLFFLPGTNGVHAAPAAARPSGVEAQASASSPTLRSNVVVLTEATVDDLIIQHPGNGDGHCGYRGPITNFTFTTQASQVTSLKPGDIMLSQYGKGFMGNVTCEFTGLGADGQKRYIVDTVSASVNQLYQAAALHHSDPVSFSLPFNFQIQANNGAATLTINGTDTVSLDWTIDFNMSWFSVNSAFYAFQMTNTFYYQFSATGAGQFQHDFQQYIDQLPLVDLGYVVLLPVLYIDISAAANVPVSLLLKQATTWTQTGWLSYDGSSWTSGYEGSQSAGGSGSIAPNLNFALTFGAPQLEFLVDALPGGPFIQIGPQFTFQSTPEQWWLNLTLQVQAGIQFNIWIVNVQYAATLYQSPADVLVSGTW